MSSTYTQQIQTADAQSGAAIRIADVSKRYGDQLVLDNVSLDIRAGEFITLLGASGSGKSTLLNILAGFASADSGRVEADGKDITRLPPHRRGLGMVFQHYALFPHMSVFDNVAFGLRRKRVPKAQVTERVNEALDLIQMRHLAHRSPDQLSGGQQQRVALARGIVFRPRVLLMDEPLGALDKLLREELQLEIRKIHQELGITFIFVTHDQHEALTMSDRIALLRNGNIVQIDTPQGLYQTPSCRYAAEFIGVSNLFAGDATSGVFEESGDGHRFRVPAGAGQTLMIRPEHVSVESRGADVESARDSVEVRVTNSVYLGSDRIVHALTRSGQSLIARTPVPSHDDGIHVGAKVSFHWDVADARLIAD